MRHIEILKDWLNGKDVQVLSGDGEWVCLPNIKESSCAPSFYDNWEYRIKPQNNKFRVALFKEHGYLEIVRSDSQANALEQCSNFKCWLTDWVEYEE